MNLTVAIQMDPIENIDINVDSTFMLAIEAQKRGHKLFYYLPSSLTLVNSKLFAEINPAELRREKNNHYSLGKSEFTDLSKLDVVLMRQDPPFAVSYTHLPLPPISSV